MVRLLFFTVIASFLFLPPAFAEVKVQTKYYYIQGRSIRQLQQAMKESEDKTGFENFYAKTDWHLKWNYKYRDMGAACLVEALQTELKITYIMPKWTNKNLGYPDLVQKWDQFYKALLTHEQGHGNIGRQAEAEVREVLPKLGAKTGCMGFNQLANAEGQRILEKYRKIEKEYDASTNHGRTQGAVFPPKE
jgi:predicted secreted Zn-dependent protease